MRKLAILIILISSTPVFSMEFRWGRIDETKKGELPRKEVIYMSGEIRYGDFDRFRAFLLENFNIYVGSQRLVTISSNGGDLVEAMKIARLIKEMYAEVRVFETCASACFTLYVSAVERISFGRIGIHRPYFDRRYFGGLRPPQAEKRQLELTKAFNLFLEANYVPRNLIDRMNETSSNEIYWLNEKEINDLGNYSNWFEEFLLAKCKRAPGILEGIDLLLYDEKEYRKYSDCKEKAILPELNGQLKTILTTGKL